MNHLILKYLVNDTEKQGLSYYFRTRRAQLFKDYIDLNFPCDETNSIKILDLGGTESFWETVGSDYLNSKGIKIDLLNRSHNHINNTEIFGSIIGDATSLDKTFFTSYDVCFSNSCIEHVGQMRDIIKFRDNVIKFENYFIQTPNFHFPIEQHFIFPFFKHLSKPIRILLIRNFNFGKFRKQSNLLEAILQDESVYLLTNSVFSELFCEAHIEKEKFLTFTKSFTAIKGKVTSNILVNRNINKETNENLSN